MPGLNQLKRFNRDMLNFGDETAKRAARGEKPITVPIPAQVKDADDSDDFVIGMPEGVSDMNGGVPMSQAEASEVDVSDLLGGGTENADDIDFSQFEEPVAADAPAEGLPPEAATSGTADGGDNTAAGDEGEADAAGDADFDELFGAEPLAPLGDLETATAEEEPPKAALVEEAVPAADAVPEAAPVADAIPEDAPVAEAIPDAAPTEEEPSVEEAASVAQELPTEAEPAPAAEPVEEVPPTDAPTAEGLSSDAEPSEAVSPGAEPAEAIPEGLPSEAEPEADDAALFDDGGEINMNEGFPQGLDNVMPDPGMPPSDAAPGESGTAPAEATSSGGAPKAGGDDDFNVDDLLSGLDFGEPDAGSSGEAAPAAEAPGTEGLPTEAAPAEVAPAEAAGEVAEPSSVEDVVPADAAPAEAAPAESAPGGGAPKASGDDDFNVDDLLSGLDFGDGGAGDGGAPSAEEAKPEAEGLPAETAPAEAASAERAVPEEAASTDGGAPAEDSAPASDALSGLDLNMGDGEAAGGIDINDALSGLDLDGDGEDAASDSGAAVGGDMGGEALSAEDSGFELDDDALHIPGYTDTDTAADVHAASEDADAGADSGANKGLPPNTLTEEQYDKFKGNFAEYPLNVRQAFENMVVQNEFTDDAQFEVVNKVLKKSSARHVASHLEKMLDISIPVPRDYEKRTASEYAAYKSSFKYQLYNRIIPAALVCLAGVLLAIGLFLFGRKFIYRPVMANRLYKQGYALLESDEYPQSESRFVEASKYKMIKKWFYRYAHGYQDHKQYQRAEKMYKNILYCFNHDKQAGIEYARMECDDLANYEKAEEIARREVLDYHINDPDGILLLGDVFLTWATEKDPSKFEDAKAQYALLMQLYGPNDMYMSRMMRYFIRTDNLREVLPLKEHFYTSKKAHLDAQDWTELSGFMLDKLYGQLSPMDEELRIQIADVMDMLQRAVRADPDNPVAMYNLSRYFVKRNSSEDAKTSLTRTIELFDTAPRRGSRDMYKELDAYRLLGEEYSKARDYIKAQEIYTDGITLYEKENRGSGFAGDKNVGTLYADAGDIDYFIRGNMDNAYLEYTRAIETNFDTPSLRYRLGYIHYNKGDYDGAINSFIKAAEENHDDLNLLLAMGNTLSLRGDNYGAQSYYERLVSELDTMRTKLFPQGILFPQVRSDQGEIVDMYLKSSNNLGVTLNRLARRTGNSRMNADAMVNLTTSMRAWDALTRNQTTMVRMPGSNLAEQNLQYMTRTASEFEPAIYTDIPKILTTDTELHQ